jgi:hypothetical protein
MLAILPSSFITSFADAFLIFSPMFSRCYTLLLLLIGSGIMALAQEKDTISVKQEIVPIVVPEAPSFNDWISQDLPLWGAVCRFPDTPYYSVKEIYTEKGLVPEKNFKWEDNEQSILLEVSSYKLPEKVNPKNEKKLAETAAQRFAVIHGGYPDITVSTFPTPPGIKAYDVEIRTIKKQLFRARIFMEGEQIMVLSALIMQAGTLPRAQARHFLESIRFNPLPGEIRQEVTVEKKGIFTKSTKEEAPWESIEIGGFSASFPKFPVSQHKVVKGQDEERKYYEWYSADGDKGTIYLLAVTPLSDETDWIKQVMQGISSTANVTSATVLSRRSLDFFRYPAEEVVMKTKHQAFRVRYFTDGQFMYQLVVGGTETNIFDPAANKFLDGLKWRN